MSRLRHWFFVQRSRIWAFVRHGRHKIASRLAANADQVTDHLFVGGFITRHDWEQLWRQDVRVVVNLQAERQDRFMSHEYYPEGYLWLPTMDHRELDLRRLRTGVAFVQAAIRNEQKILIHCHAGMGRSVLLCCAVLIAEGSTVEQAWNHVKLKRPIAELHPWQWQALRAFAAEQNQHMEVV